MRVEKKLKDLVAFSGELIEVSYSVYLCMIASNDEMTVKIYVCLTFKIGSVNLF